MAWRERLPLLGTVKAGGDVYEIREGRANPVTVWRDGAQIGHVSAYEVQMASEGHTPHVFLDRERFREHERELPALPPYFFRLRQAVGLLLREPGGVILVSQLEVKLPQRTQR